MARPKGTSIKKNVEKKDDTLIKENEKLKSEMEQLKIMLETLNKKLEDSKSQDNNEDSDVQSLDENIYIEPRERIKVTSLFHGGLNLTGLNNKPIRFERFGQQKYVYYEDLVEICTRNSGLIEKGLVFIHDERVIKSEYLEDKYKKIIDFKTLKNIFKLPEKEIESIYLNTTKELQKTIIHTFAKWINDNDPSYMDKNKIETINRISGHNVLEIAEKLKTYEK